jgi:putative ABC transport system ATP-binding protein
LKEIIKITDLVKEFNVGASKVIALNSVNLTVFENDFIALMGPSGSGKSTLLNVLGWLDTSTSGIYLLDGQKVEILDNEQLARIRNLKIGFIFQSFFLLPNYTALQNVQLPLIYAGIHKDEQVERAKKALEMVNLEKRSSHRPNQLSGGERQRVAIVRALVNKPSIILADEPTGNLDSSTAIEIISIIEKLHNAGNTIILVTHDSNIAGYASKIRNIKDGTIITAN